MRHCAAEVTRTNISLITDRCWGRDSRNLKKKANDKYMHILQVAYTLPARNIIVLF